MVVAGRVAWERSQHRLALVAAAQQLPTLKESKVLFLASQIAALCRQLSDSSQRSDGVTTMRRLVAIDGHIDTNIALLTCLLLRACCNNFNNSGEYGANKPLGVWHAWKLSADNLLPALEALEWEEWIIPLLFWLPDCTKWLPSFLQTVSKPAIRDRLVCEAARYLHRRLGSSNQRIILEHDTEIMQALDALFLEYSWEGVVGVKLTAQELLEALDSALAGGNKLNNSSPSNTSDQEKQNDQNVRVLGGSAFQAACQLRARLSLSLQLNPIASESREGAPSTVENITGGCTSSGPSIWQTMLHIDPAIEELLGKKEQKKGPATNNSSSTAAAAEKAAVALAAVAAVSAFFGDFDTLITEDKIPTAAPAAIRLDPNPVSPGRILWSALHMLSKATNSADLREGSSLLPGDVAMYARLLLPRLCWSAAELVEHREQQNAVLYYTLHTEPKEKIGGDYSHEFQDWAAKELVSITNRLRTTSRDAIEVAGSSSIVNVGTAVNALFPCALLHPERLLEKLLDGATSQPGQSELLCGVLTALPALANAPAQHRQSSGDIGKAAAAPLPIIITLLADQLGNSELLESDSQKAALEGCILGLAQGGARRRVTKESQGSGQKATGVSSTVAAAVPPEELLRHVALPSLQSPTSDRALSLRVARRLVSLMNFGSLQPDIICLEKREVSEESSGSVFSLGGILLRAALEPLNNASRRIDLSSQGLKTPMEVIEEAKMLADECIRTLHTGPTGGRSLYLERERSRPAERNVSVTNVPSVWDLSSALCKGLQQAAVRGLLTTKEDKNEEVARNAWASKTATTVPLPSLREALVVSCAVLLPCCTAEEAENILRDVQLVIKHALQLHYQQQPGADSALVAEGAVIELASRAIHALALVPSLIPIADEVLDVQNGPSELRRVAVARLMQRVSGQCHKAVAAAVPSLRPALAARAFHELARCTGAIWKHYDCSALQVGLLHLVNIALSEEEGAEAGAQSSGEVKSVIDAAIEYLKGSPLEAVITSALEQNSSKG